MKKFIKIISKTIALLVKAFAIIMIVILVASAPTIIAGMMIGAVGIFLLALIYSIPMAIVLWFYPMNHPKRIALVKKIRAWQRQSSAK